MEATKLIYEKPSVEVIELMIEDSILNAGSSTYPEDYEDSEW